MSLVTVVGIDEFRQRLRDADRDAPKMLTRAAKDAAQIVAVEARRHAPVRSGVLRRTIRAAGARGYALVRVGRGIPYEGPIHFGWERHPNEARDIRGGPISAQPFLTDALAAKKRQAVALFEVRLRELLDRRFP